MFANTNIILLIIIVVIIFINKKNLSIRLSDNYGVTLLTCNTDVDHFTIGGRVVPVSVNSGYLKILISSNSTLK